MNLVGVLALLLLFILSFISLLVFPKFRIVTTLIMFGVVTLALYFGWQGGNYSKAYSSIHIGMTKRDVKEIMGKPKYVSDCSITYYGNKRTKYDPPVEGCVEEYWYYSFFTPEAWEYSFGENDKLIFQYHWTSP